jgi:uncharacterized membrane protein YphA (DoxX/SURF4 family)
MTMLLPLLTAIAILLLSYLFVVGALQKLAHTAYFRQVITDYQILPRTWSPLLARTLPLVELGAGLALLIPASRTTALGAVTLLLGAYSAAIALNIVRGRRDIDCGCAGPGQEQTLSGWLLGRNAVLITLALLAVLGPQQLQLDWSGWCLALMGTALAALLYHVFNQLVANNNLLRRIARHG